MTILGVKEKSSDILEIATVEGPVFLLRLYYLPELRKEDFVTGAVFSEEKETEILDAGMCFSIERKAMDYLARAEQSRFGLTRKLLEKDFEKALVNRALDFLEAKNFLSDRRFARSWLNARSTTKYEGRIRLLSELASRFIDKEIASDAVDEFFNEKDEREICKKALKKYKGQGKEGEKLMASMQRSGFSYSMIKSVQEEMDEEN